jgi:hypothetical protein
MTFSTLRALLRVRSLTARVLSDEAHFGDGPPTWRNAPTSGEAGKARERAIKRLRRFADDFAWTEQLADILVDCKPDYRCMSGACPECGRAFQRWFVSQVEVLADSGSEDPHSASIIFSKHRTRRAFARR